MSTETLPTTIEHLDVDFDVDAYQNADDPDVRAHIVLAGQNPHVGGPDTTAQQLIDLARMDGTTLIALCGHKFVPKHNPEKSELCKPCAVILGCVLMRPFEIVLILFGMFFLGILTGTFVDLIEVFS